MGHTRALVKIRLAQLVQNTTKPRGMYVLFITNKDPKTNTHTQSQWLSEHSQDVRLEENPTKDYFKQNPHTHLHLKGTILLNELRNMLFLLPLVSID